MLSSERIFNNYKELCEYMEWKVYKSDSNSYKAQMKELDTLCKWHKEKRMFIIDEVYSKPLAKQDNRRKKSVYIDLIKEIFLFKLNENKLNDFVSVRTIIKEFGIFEKAFYDLYTREAYTEVACNLEVSNFIVRGFKLGAFREVQRIVERAIASLQRQNIISYEQGIIIVTNQGLCRFADINEMKTIKILELDQLKSMKCKNMASMKFRGLENQFYKGLKKKFLHMGLDYIDYTFYGYRILTYDHEEVQLVKANDIEVSVNKLKELFKIRLMQFAQSTHGREVKKEFESVAFGEPLLENNSNASGIYLVDFKKLIEYFINTPT